MQGSLLIEWFYGKIDTMKRVFIIHGYRSYPSDCWFPRLKKDLEKRDFKVFVPQMPSAANPKEKSWVLKIKKIVGKSDKNTFVVGHSLGVIALLRYLESLKSKEKIGGLISVAGRLFVESYPKNRNAKLFFKKRIQWSKILKNVKQVVGIYSKDDPVVSVKNALLLKKKLKAKLILEKNKGHFTRSDKIFKLPVVLDEIIKMSIKN